MMPEGWKFCKINELNQYITSGSRGWAQYYSDTGNLFVRITNLTRERLSLDLSDSKYVKIPENNSDGKRTRLMMGDILISITADLGIIGFIEDKTNTPIYINQHIALLRIKEKAIHNKFVAYQMASEAGHKQFLSLNDAGAKSGLNLDSIRIFQIIIPPLPEQCKIAEILGAWDESIALLEKLITAKRKLKQGLMQQLLTGKKCFKEFEGSDWDIVSLGDLCSVITKGTTPSSVGFEFCKRGINYVKIESINERGQFLIKKLAKISEKAHQALKRSQLKESDILFSIAGALGRVAIVENNILPANTNQALAIIRLRPEYLNCHKYLFQYLKSELIAKHIERINVQAAQANLSLSQLNDFRIIFPSLPEQEKIASVLSAADTEISTLEKQLAAYKQQKRGLMQQLLTGKKRVRVN